MDNANEIKVFDKPTEFFKWAWDYEADLNISVNGEIFRGRTLIARLSFFKRK